jgi:diphthamide synthase (EF-2-diphthine--ammonia ligase)
MAALAHEFLDGGFEACGENGEFHTFVSAGPIFSSPIACERSAARSLSATGSCSAT